MRAGIIGGTGVYDLGEEWGLSAATVETPYGTVELMAGRIGGREVAFLPRHGRRHTVPPHRVNYRAHVDALRRWGCDRVVATHAVGSLRHEMPPGDFVLPDQFIDWTRQRAATFFEGGGLAAGGPEGAPPEVRHVDVTVPYCPELRRCALEGLRRRSLPVHPAAVYVCTEGPRFESPAEIRMFERLGGDLVGMTGLPEVVLAREAGICYASVCVVTNFAAGIAKAPLTQGEVTEIMAQRVPLLRELLVEMVAAAPQERGCGCE